MVMGAKAGARHSQVGMSSKKENVMSDLDIIENFLDRDRRAAQSWRGSIRGCRGKKVALKSWVANHDMVETLQMTIVGGNVTSARTAGGREVDTTKRASGVFLDQSFREYAGITCLFASSDVWIGQCENFNQTIVYRTL